MTLRAPGAKHVAIRDLRIAIARIELQPIRDIVGDTRHEGVGKAPAVPPAVGSTARRPGAGPACPDASRGFMGRFPVDPGRSDTGTEIRRETGKRRQIDIAVCHQAERGKIGAMGKCAPCPRALTRARTGGHRRPVEAALEIFGRQVGTNDVGELIAEAYRGGGRLVEACVVEGNGFRAAKGAVERISLVQPGCVADVATQIKAAAAGRFRRNRYLGRVEQFFVGGLCGERRLQAGAERHAAKSPSPIHAMPFRSAKLRACAYGDAKRCSMKLTIRVNYCRHGLTMG